MLRKHLLCIIALVSLAIICGKAFSLDSKPNSRNLQGGSSAAKKASKDFQDFKKKNNKRYAAGQESYRAFAFFENSNQVDAHNKDADQGKHTYRKDKNKFSDQPYEEFKASHAMPDTKPPEVVEPPKKGGKRRLITWGCGGAQVTLTPAASVNWAAAGAVTAVKYQGNCGSCWAFATTGNLEGANFIKNGVLRSFSEQQLVDCSTSFYYNNGCNGGRIDTPLWYTRDYGITTSAAYPYTGVQGACKPFTPVYRNSDCVYVNTYSVNALKSALNKGPVAVAVYVTNNFQFYGSGVFTDTTCPQGYLNHGVLAVGYSSTVIGGQTIGYWIVKNSWSQYWGNSGYILIAQNGPGVTSASGVCGILLWEMLALP